MDLSVPIYVWFVVVVIITIAMKVLHNHPTFRRSPYSWQRRFLWLRLFYFMMIQFIRFELPNLITVFGLATYFISSLPPLTQKFAWGPQQNQFIHFMIWFVGCVISVFLVTYSISVFLSEQKERSDYKEIREWVQLEKPVFMKWLPKQAPDYFLRYVELFKFFILAIFALICGMVVLINAANKV